MGAVAGGAAPSPVAAVNAGTRVRDRDGGAAAPGRQSPGDGAVAAGAAGADGRGPGVEVGREGQVDLVVAHLRDELQQTPFHLGGEPLDGGVLEQVADLEGAVEGDPQAGGDRDRAQGVAAGRRSRRGRRPSAGRAPRTRSAPRHVSAGCAGRRRASGADGSGSGSAAVSSLPCAVRGRASGETRSGRDDEGGSLVRQWVRQALRPRPPRRRGHKGRTRRAVLPP